MTTTHNAANTTTRKNGYNSKRFEQDTAMGGLFWDDIAREGQDVWDERGRNLRLPDGPPR
jgi:hypothetical protein